eukprot:2629054-Rhodomonas_salina.1
MCIRDSSCLSPRAPVPLFASLTTLPLVPSVEVGAGGRSEERRAGGERGQEGEEKRERAEGKGGREGGEETSDTRGRQEACCA